MSFQKITEMESPHRHLEQRPVAELLQLMNEEDNKVADAVKKVLPQIAELVSAITERLQAGGRLFYIGAGTSGRMGFMDASECSPTFGVPNELIQAIIAGGPQAFTRAVEFAEDDTEKGWHDLEKAGVGPKDFVLGISASGTAPYVLHALIASKNAGIQTAALVCNAGAPICGVVDFAIEIPVGPEFITGSTRLKAGTAQKMVLNMVSTSVMIKLGRVLDNKMVHMQLSNEKLIQRGTSMVMKMLNISDQHQARALLMAAGSVKAAIKNYHP